MVPEKWNYKCFTILWYWDQKLKLDLPKYPMSIRNVATDKKMISNHVSFGKKGF